MNEKAIGTRELEETIREIGGGSVRIAKKGAAYRLVSRAGDNDWQVVAFAVAAAGFRDGRQNEFTADRLADAAVNGGAFLYHVSVFKEIA